MKEATGYKADHGKPDYSLIPATAVAFLAPCDRRYRFVELVFDVTDYEDDDPATEADIEVWNQLIDQVVYDFNLTAATHIGGAPRGAARARAYVWDQVVAVLKYGVKKYGRDNWQLVPDATRRYRAAARRHAVALLCGGCTEDNADEESGLPHWAHVLACLMFLTWFKFHPEVEPA